MNPTIHDLTDVFPCALSAGLRRALDEALGAFTEKEALAGILRAVARRDDDLTADSLDWYYSEELEGDAAVGRWSLKMHTNDYSRAGGAVLSMALRASDEKVTLTLNFRPLGFAEARVVTVVGCQRPAEALKSLDISKNQGSVFIYAGRPADDSPPSWLQGLTLKRCKEVDMLLSNSLQEAVAPPVEQPVQRRTQRALPEAAKAQRS